MRVIGLEEHFVIPEILDAWSSLGPAPAVDPALMVASQDRFSAPLLEVGSQRFEAMDANGIDAQVISLPPPGLQILNAADAVALQSVCNDRLADLVRDNPARLQGFASLASQDPAAAAAEFERAVTVLGLDGAMLLGRAGELTLDHVDSWPILEVADALRAPIYLHPQTPPATVRDAYYRFDDPMLSTAVTLFGLGWHYEAGMQLVRLVLSGVFDRFPNLQIITGHWGEVVMFYLERLKDVMPFAKLQRPLLDYFRENVYITPAGIYSERYMRWAIETIGVDRVLFATDYPFIPIPDGTARGFLESAQLSDRDREAIASGNWERLRAAIRRTAS